MMLYDESGFHSLTAFHKLYVPPWRGPAGTWSFHTVCVLDIQVPFSKMTLYFLGVRHGSTDDFASMAGTGSPVML
jgi:hypothetical protein